MILAKFSILVTLSQIFPGAGQANETAPLAISLGPRPYYLIEKMADSPLKSRLKSCANGPFHATDFSIGHRGAQLMFPEHTIEANTAAARMGAGVLECDVTFTKDRTLVCRHAQNDLHRTTNILGTNLASKCAVAFAPATETTKARASCKTSDLTQEEFLSLEPKMDAANPQAKTLTDYMNATANWRTDLYANGGTTLMTHAQSIAHFAALGAKFMPELKTPSVDMPFNGYTQNDFAQALIDDYKSANIPAKDVWPQSFNLEDILYWIENEPEFGAQAVFLDSSYRDKNWSSMDAQTWHYSMSDLKSLGLNYIAPPIWALLTVENGEIVPSLYANHARAAHLKIIAWSIERSGPLNNGGGWYFQSVKSAISGDNDLYEIIDVLAQKVGVSGIFSDWPATVTYYANCMGLE